MKVIPGMQSESVGELQDLLKANGFMSGPTDGYYGEMTGKALSQFQASANHVIDPMTSNETFDALRRFVKTTDKAATLRKEQSIQVVIPAGVDPIARAILECALSQLHTEEFPIGTNRGITVDRYTRRWGIPWSACFVSWCIEEARWYKGEKKKVLSEYLYHPRDWVEKLMQEGRWMCGDSIQPGDVWYVGHAADRNLHMGWCVDVKEVEDEEGKKERSILTIEGNTANGVRCRERKMESLMGWGRPYPIPL